MSPCLHLHAFISMSPCIYVSMFPEFQNRKMQLPFVSCKRKTETENFRLFAANGNGKRKFIFLGSKR
jgi:hypothetical protein